MKEQKPHEVVKIFDNKGFSLDRYTISVFIKGRYFMITSDKNIFTLDFGEGFKFNEVEYTSDKYYKKSIGKEVEWNNLPKIVREEVKSKIDEKYKEWKSDIYVN